MVLLRRVIGDALRSRRQGQQRTLREVSSAANVSLGYLSEVERGQKEPSSELLAAICDALGARLSEVLREVSDTVAVAERLPNVLVPIQERHASDTAASAVSAPASPAASAVSAAASPVAPSGTGDPARGEAAAHAGRAEIGLRTLPEGAVRHQLTGDAEVSVSVRQDSPLKATLRTTRRMRTKNERDVVRAA